MTHAHRRKIQLTISQPRWKQKSLPFLLKIQFLPHVALLSSIGAFRRPRTCCSLSGISLNTALGFEWCSRAGGEQGWQRSLCILLALAQAAGCVVVVESQHWCSRLLICFSKNRFNSKFLKILSWSLFFKHVIFLTCADRLTYLELLVLFIYLFIYFTAPSQLNNLSPPICTINTSGSASSTCSCHGVSQSTKILI